MTSQLWELQLQHPCKLQHIEQTALFITQSVCQILNVCYCVSFSVKPAPVGATAAHVALKEDDFPSLSTAAVSAPMTPAYSAQPKKTSSFQEEDFPALVPKVRLMKPAAGTNSAWSNHSTVAKPVPQPPPSSRSAPPVSSVSSGPQLLSSSASSSSRRKKKVGESTKTASRNSPLISDDEDGGMTQQEFRSVPTMLDISSLLTVKGGNSKPSTVTSQSSNPPPITDPLPSKANKKKKQKNTTASSTSMSTTPGMMATVNTISVETAAQKENVPEKTWNKPLSSAVTATVATGLANGYTDTSAPVGKESSMVTPHVSEDPTPEQEEEFPALMTKKPPPGMTQHRIHLYAFRMFTWEMFRHYLSH